MSDTEKTKILIGVAEIYGFSLGELSLSIYLSTLKELAPKDLMRIVEYGMKANLWKFMPKPGELLSVIKLAENTKMELEAKNEFDKILNSIRRNGRNHPIELSEVGKSALRQVGGIQRIAEASDEDLVWIRKDFDACFELNADKTKIDTRRLALVDKTGLTDQRENIRQISGSIGKMIGET